VLAIAEDPHDSQRKVFQGSKSSAPQISTRSCPCRKTIVGGKPAKRR
jgi:hypothetical protein